jgi:hypothetical protein
MSKMRIQLTRGWLCSEGSQVFAIVKRYRLYSINCRKFVKWQHYTLCLFFFNFAHYFLNLHERSWQTFLAKPETEMSKMRIRKTRGWLCSEGSQVFAIVKRYRLPIFCQMTELHFCLFNLALFLKIAHKNSSKMYTSRA